MDTIKDATKASLEASAKMVASQVENQYTVAKTLGKQFLDTGSCMEDYTNGTCKKNNWMHYGAVDSEEEVT